MDTSLISERDRLQARATQNALDSLARCGRAVINWFCGTGKTRIGAMVAKQLDARITVILAPSVALVDGQREEWELARPGLELHTVHYESSDLDNTIIEDEIARWMADPEPQAIFCTYHSAPRLAEALKRYHGSRLDLLIFDEAHRTAGHNQDRLFSFGLEDENLPARHRLFLTATPRQIGEEGETLYSMENEEVYGPIVDSLNCREAIDAGFICDYRIVVATLGDEVEAPKGEAERMALLAVSLHQLTEEFGCQKIFTFHRKIDSAVDFCAFLGVAPANRLSHYHLGHVNGLLPAQTFSSRLADFKAASRGLLTNSLCLTEGVNVPGVDTIVFTDPKHSDIGIIQAIGRALRLDPARPDKIATVVLPLYGFYPKEFAKLRAVLSALRESDRRVRGGVREWQRSVRTARPDRPDWVLVRGAVQQAERWNQQVERVRKSFLEGDYIALRNEEARLEKAANQLEESLARNGSLSLSLTAQGYGIKRLWWPVEEEALLSPPDKQGKLHRALAYATPATREVFLDHFLTVYEHPIFQRLRAMDPWYHENLKIPLLDLRNYCAGYAPPFDEEKARELALWLEMEPHDFTGEEEPQFVPIKGYEVPMPKLEPPVARLDVLHKFFKDMAAREIITDQAYNMFCSKFGLGRERIEGLFNIGLRERVTTERARQAMLRGERSFRRALFRFPWLVEFLWEEEFAWDEASARRPLPEMPPWWEYFFRVANMKKEELQWSMVRQHQKVSAAEQASRYLSESENRSTSSSS